MADDTVSATTVINAPAEAIFAVLADPAKHAAVDGTGWVRETLDSKPLTAAGQVFRMSMYHHNHPDGSYQTVNRVQAFDPPSAISWEPGYEARRRHFALRRLDLALRPRANWTREHHSHSLMTGQQFWTPSESTSDSRGPSGASGQLARPPRRTGYLSTSLHAWLHSLTPWP
jgi:uncharacterized protein YndB with AHSA1/START domain